MKKRYRIHIDLYEVDIDENGDIQDDRQLEGRWFGDVNEYETEQEAREVFNELVQD